jgi:hypothetical protein
MATASAADKRRLLADLATSRRGGRGAFLGRVAGALGVGVAVLFVILWLAGWFSGPRSVREVRGLVDEQIAILERVARNETPMMEASFAPVFERMRDMPREYREQVRGDLGRLFAAREAAEINSFFTLPPAERQAELDRRIRAEQARRQSREAGRGPGSGGRGPGDSGDRWGGRAEGGPGGGNPQAGGGTPPGPRRGGGTEEDRNLRRKASIDRTTPEQRARRAEYRRVLQERREQLAASGGRR